MGAICNMLTLFPAPVNSAKHRNQDMRLVYLVSRPTFIESDVGSDFPYKTKPLNPYAKYGISKLIFLTSCDLAVPTRPAHEFRQYEVRRSQTLGCLQTVLCYAKAIRHANFVRRDNEDPLKTTTQAQDEDNTTTWKASLPEGWTMSFYYY